MATELNFRTPPDGENIPAGQTRTLGTAVVDRYRQIRVIADERRGSANDVDVRLTITEGDELVAQLDVLKLTPGLEVTKVYDVPGTKLAVFASSTDTKPGSSTVDVLVYGFASPVAGSLFVADRRSGVKVLFE
jgi:type III secretion protein HrpB1